MGTRAARADMRTDLAVGTVAMVLLMVVVTVTKRAVAMHTLALTRLAATRGTHTVHATR